jgi:putative peptidoglycan lipid II flippase
VMLSLFLTVIGVGAVQINNAVDGVFARFASLEGPAYLWYAIRLQQLPLALFGVALSSVLLPPLSRAEPTEQDALLMYGLKRSFSLMMPCTIGTLVLGCTSINLLYGRGDFSQEATYQTIICLWGYGLGLIPSVFVLLLAPSFYAQKNYKTPALFSVMSVVVNMVFNGLFVFLFKWGPLSIALATSLGAFFNLWLLMRKKNLKISLEVWVHFGKIFCISCLAGSTVLCLGLFLKDPTWAVLQGKEVVFSRHLQEQIVQCGTLTACYAFLVWGMILLSKKFSRIYE